MLLRLLESPKSTPKIKHATITPQIIIFSCICRCQRTRSSSIACSCCRRRWAGPWNSPRRRPPGWRSCRSSCPCCSASARTATARSATRCVYAASRRTASSTRWKLWVLAPVAPLDYIASFEDILAEYIIFGGKITWIPKK